MHFKILQKLQRNPQRFISGARKRIMTSRAHFDLWFTRSKIDAAEADRYSQSIETLLSIYFANSFKNKPEILSALKGRAKSFKLF